MNRTTTRDQNDISIIIGNLPKRLQEKIKIRERNNATSNTASINSSASVSTIQTDVDIEDERQGKYGVTCTMPLEGAAGNKASHYAADANEMAITSIDCLGDPGNINNDECKRENHVLETDGLTVGETLESIPIPGLIRLKAENVKQLNETKFTSNSARHPERRNRQHPTRQEVLVFSSRGDVPMSPARQLKKLDHPSWFSALDGMQAERLSVLFDELQQIMHHNQMVENWQNFRNASRALQEIFKNLLLTHLKFCCEQKVDSFFWKILFYNVREHLKQLQNDYLAIEGIHEVIEEGIAFYDHLYKKLVSQYLNKPESAISLYKCDSQMQQQQRSQHKLEFIAKVTAQKLLICLGDLWRYKIKDMQGQDYVLAEKYYQKAQAWVPSNGVPYNQLAIVAILNRKKFCAIYFHMRSLMSSNVIYSSKESLLVLFDEVRKKYEETELKTSPVHSYHNNQQPKALRKEVWIYPDGMRRLHRTNLNSSSSYSKLAVSEEKRYMDMPAEELQRRITALFLYIIGKLFTGVGMETVVEHQRKFLLQLSVLLKNYNYLTIPRTKFLKILALSIFVTELNIKNDTRRYHAFNFGNQILGLLLHKANNLLTELDKDLQEFKEERFLDLNTLLQYIRIYTLWLKHHVTIWEPTKSEDHIFLNTWSELEKLINLIKRQNFPSYECPDIQLEEDTFFAGFTPLAAIIPRVKNDYISDDNLQFQERLKIISEFQRCYEDNRHRLENAEASQTFVNEILNSDIKQALDELQVSQPVAGNMKIDKTNESVTEEDDVDNEDLENIVINGESTKKSTSALKSQHNNTNEQNSQLSHLSKLKKELEAKSNVKKMYSDKLEDILKIVDTKVYIEVRPRYLLPDTNCFIDCLDDFERIINNFKRFTLVVPLTVVKELDGLSKGMKVEPYQDTMQKHRIHHYDDVSTKAKKSLEFIKSAKSHVKCATTKGSIINASLFALVEEENISNDDKILATALSLSRTMSSETSKDGKCFIQTELVLITTDRNLRVKALTRNLAVSELPEFLQWAQDCSN